MVSAVRVYRVILLEKALGGRHFGRAAALLWACLIAQPAPGAGLILYEINAPTTGTASAGWSALAADASTAFTNPAGMTRLDRSQLLGGAQPVIVDSKFDSMAGTMVPGGGATGETTPWARSTTGTRS